MSRLEMRGGWAGHPEAGTFVAHSEPPYRVWEGLHSKVTRLDGPVLFRWGESVFAAGRRHIASPAPFHSPGSLLGKKRTALYEVREQELVYLVDLPSCGDTGYPGVVVTDTHVHLSYYSNCIRKDPHWLTGLFLPTEIRLSSIERSQFETFRGRNE